MQTLKQFLSNAVAIPSATAWYLTDLSQAMGRQELYTKQSPQRLKTLREHALIESAVSSNRIEGITAETRRLTTVVFGRSHLKDRNEEEIRGYRNVLNKIHTGSSRLPISEKTIRLFHKLTRGDIWDAGSYKEKDGDIIETYPDGRSRIRFKTVSAKDTSQFMNELMADYNECLKEKSVPSLVALCALNLDFLCIHPFRDGNGRVSRLLLLLCCYHFGFEVGRFISLERLIEQNKERYYETLEQSSQHWHQEKHDPWPYINFLLYILKSAYKEFEERVGVQTHKRGAKTNLVQSAIENFSEPFSISELEQACPTVGRDMIRVVLNKMRAAKKIECSGSGRNALWKKR